MKLMPLAALVALTVPTIASAQNRPSKPNFSPNVPDYQLDTQVYDFPTGLRIMMQSDRSHPVAGVFTVVDHGTKDDPPGKEETAHFVEHTWFRSKQLEFPSIMNFVFDYGTLFNATTRNDWTDFRTVASSEYLPILLQLESARLTTPYIGVTEEMIDTEREVIRNEWRRRNEQNAALFVDYMYEAVYPKDHPYHDHSTHGSIDNIKLADLQKFFDDYYHPDTTTIFVIGDFDPNAALDLVFDNFDPAVLDPRLDPKEDYFEYPRPGVDTSDPSKLDQNNPDLWYTGAWDPSTRGMAERKVFQFADPEKRAPRITQDPSPVPPLGTTEVLTRQGPFEHKAVAIGWSLPGGFRQDMWNLEMVGNTASQYVGSGPLFRDWRDPDDPKVGDIGCFSMTEVINTTVLCYADILDDKLDPLYVRDKMIDNLAEMWNPENFTGIGFNGQIYNTYFTRAKLGLLSNKLLSLDLFASPFGGRNEDIVPHAHLTNSIKAVSDAMDAAMKADPAVISKLAYEYLRRDRVATVILEPLPEDEIDVGSEKSSYAGSNVMDSAMEFSGDLRQFDDPAVLAAEYVQPDLTKLVDYTLDNGLRVLIFPYGEAPIVETRLILGRNSDAEEKGAFGFAQRFAQSTGNDPLPIAAEVSWAVSPPVPGLQPGQGYPLETWAGTRQLYMDVRAPSGNLDGSLWLIREELETARPYMDGIGDYVESREKALKRGWADPDWHITNAVNHYLFPGMDTRQPLTWEEVQAMRKWGASNVDAYLKTAYQPQNATLVVVGNINPEDAKKNVQTYFGGWQARKDAPAPPAEVQPPSLPSDPPEILIFNDPGRTQTDVTMYCRLDLKDEPGEDVAVDVLSSLMGDRIFNEIRVNRGLAYSPGAASFIDDGGAGRAQFYSDGVINSGVGQILQYYKQVVHEVATGDIDNDELLMSKVRHARGDGVPWQSVGQVSDNLTTMVENDRDPAAVAHRGQDLAGIDIAQVSALLTNCDGHAITTVEGPKDIVIPQLDELGYTYQVVEWRANGDDLLWKYDPKAAKKKEKDRLKKEKKDAKQKEKEASKGDGSADGGH
ncbi:MAG: insulinase family protein [Alphaproteobacteria bacterium]|nr:insulinase family protein [Alphaproteobacteria bacterium]MCB9695464.1 insulinase family protein [Alphaproteobacteria bacterium]